MKVHLAEMTTVKAKVIAETVGKVILSVMAVKEKMSVEERMKGMLANAMEVDGMMACGTMVAVNLMGRICYFTRRVQLLFAQLWS